MNKEVIRDYLRGLGSTKVVTDRVLEIHALYESWCPEELIDCFISEYRNEENEREYESLWFLSNRYLMEAKDFLSSDHFDLAIIKHNILRWEIRGQEYSYEQATNKSRLSIEVAVKGHITARLKASQENCDTLMKVFRKHFRSNLAPYDRYDQDDTNELSL